MVGSVLEDDGLAEELRAEGVQDPHALLQRLVVVVLVGDDDAQTAWGDEYLLTCRSSAHS
jgi:hypothetical protein